MGEKSTNQIIDEYAIHCLNEDKLKAFLDFWDFLIRNKFGKAKTGKKSKWFSVDSI